MLTLHEQCNYASYNPTLFHDYLEAASWDEVLALQDVKEGCLAKAYTKFTRTVFNDEQSQGHLERFNAFVD